MGRKLLLVLVYFALAFSFTEWFIHAGVMHNAHFSLGHIHTNHHKSTNDTDMSLAYTTEENKRAVGARENLVLYPYEIVGGAVPAFVLSLYIFPRTNRYFLAFMCVFSVCWECFVWNTMHPALHGRCGSAQNAFLARPYDTAVWLHKNFPYFRWVVHNHVAHHAHKGVNKGNYNVVWPGADFLMGTYNAPIPISSFPPLETSP